MTALFSEKLEHVSIFDPCGTLKVNGGHLKNATICGISEKMLFMLLLNSVQSLTVLTFCAHLMGLAALFLNKIPLPFFTTENTDVMQVYAICVKQSLDGKLV